MELKREREGESGTGTPAVDQLHRATRVVGSGSAAVAFLVPLVQN